MTTAGLPAYIGPNRIVRRLGKGGMGVVYFGYTPGNRPVAVKIARIEPDDSETAKKELISLFRREIKLVRKINNPFVVKLIDSSEHNGLPWASFEYIEGQDLGQLFAGNTKMPIAFTCAIGVAVCHILKALHAAEIIHRDLKPSNLMLTSRGDIKVIDFGIASSQEITAISQRHAAAGVGSAPYMAPEIWRSEEPTFATDIFSLGAILGEAISGHKMFPHGLSQIGHVIQHGQPSLGGIPNSFATIISRCLTKNPAERPTLNEIEAVLTQICPALGVAKVRRDDNQLAATVRQLVKEARDGKTLLYPPGGCYTAIHQGARSSGARYRRPRHPAWTRRCPPHSNPSQHLGRYQ